MLSESWDSRHARGRRQKAAVPRKLEVSGAGNSYLPQGPGEEWGPGGGAKHKWRWWPESPMMSAENEMGDAPSLDLGEKKAHLHSLP